MSARLVFPGIGDHVDVGIELSALDLDRGRYIVQAGDQLGALATLIYPGATADEAPPLPAPGTQIDLPLYATMMLRQAVARAEQRVDVVIPSALSGQTSIADPRVRWLGEVGGFERQDVVRLVEAFVGYHQGQPQFEEVTQGRQAPGYSACGDLWNFVLERIGVRDPAIVNRNIPSVGIKWQSQKNLSTPYSGAVKNKAWVMYKPGLVPSPGDLVLIGTYPEQIQHALVHLSADGSNWKSGDYGQVDIGTGLPSSKFVMRTQSGLKLGSRDLLGWIDITKLPRAAALDLTGVPPSGTSSPAGPTKKSNLFLELATGAVIAAGVIFLW